MRSFLQSSLVVGLFALGSAAVAQVPVNIVYPIDGSMVPITDPPAGGLSSAYITVSFSVTCGGDDTVEWGFDSFPPIGEARFYDQITVQQVYKLTGGPHRFWVRSPGCGDDVVSFDVGS